MNENFFPEIRRDRTIIVNLRIHPSAVQEDNYAYVGRGSIFGNPFTHLDLKNTGGLVKVKTREEAIEKYEKWLNGEINIEGIRPPTDEEIKILHGKILGCFCFPKPCHAEVLRDRARKLNK